jgi:hypothetical protein
MGRVVSRSWQVEMDRPVSLYIPILLFNGVRLVYGYLPPMQSSKLEM